LVFFDLGVFAQTKRDEEERNIMACPYRECTKYTMCDECHMDTMIENRFRKERKFPNE
jgi:hypothetical protein